MSTGGAHWITPPILYAITSVSVNSSALTDMPGVCVDVVVIVHVVVGPAVVVKVMFGISVNRIVPDGSVAKPYWFDA